MPQLPSSAPSSYLSPSRQMSPSRQLLPSRGKLRGLQQCLCAAHRGGALVGRWRGTPEQSTCAAVGTDVS